MITVRNLSKSYKDVKALDNVSVNFAKGVIYGLLGRNGAGKTTLINIITNRVFADSGSYEIDGISGRESYIAQGKIFCMTEKGGYPTTLRVRELLEFIKGFYPNFDIKYAYELCEIFGLNVKKRISGLSTGYVTIFKIVATLASGAEVMIFDEPALGLDAAFRDLFYKKMLERYQELGNTIIISTHLIEEIAGILEKVVIIRDGKIIEDTDTEDIVKRACVLSGEEGKVMGFAEKFRSIGSERLGKYLAVTVDGRLSDNDIAEAERLGINISPAKLQDVFIKLTDRGV